MSRKNAQVLRYLIPTSSRRKAFSPYFMRVFHRSHQGKPLLMRLRRTPGRWKCRDGNFGPESAHRRTRIALGDPRHKFCCTPVAASHPTFSQSNPFPAISCPPGLGLPLLPTSIRDRGRPFLRRCHPERRGRPGDRGAEGPGSLRTSGQLPPLLTIRITTLLIRCSSHFGTDCYPVDNPPPSPLLCL